MCGIMWVLDWYEREGGEGLKMFMELVGGEMVKEVEEKVKELYDTIIYPHSLQLPVTIRKLRQNVNRLDGSG